MRCYIGICRHDHSISWLHLLACVYNSPLARADDNLWVQKGVKRRTSGFFTGDLKEDKRLFHRRPLCELRL